MEMFYYIVFVLEIILKAMGSLFMVITNKMYKLIIYIILYVCII